MADCAIIVEQREPRRELAKHHDRATAPLGGSTVTAPSTRVSPRPGKPAALKFTI